MTRHKIASPTGVVHYAREREWMAGVRRTYCGRIIRRAWTSTDEARSCSSCIGVADAENNGRRTKGRTGGL